MIQPSKIFGRLGNSLFQYAFLYAYAKDHEIDFYYQDEAFFSDYADEIRALFSADIPKPIDAVAIHVRRGDYVNNPFYVDLAATDYYERSMAEFPNENFLVFSDDIPWCKSRFGMYNPKIRYSEGKSELQDLNTMAACKGHIIANSSFSWWASWLSPKYPNNKTVAPSADNWYRDGVERTICPDHWVRL